MHREGVYTVLLGIVCLHFVLWHSPGLRAGSCPVQDLPDQLLYEISSNLDAKSQQKLFMSSVHLYSRWYIQTPARQLFWHFLDWGLDALSGFRPEGEGLKSYSSNSSMATSCIMLVSAATTLFVQPLVRGDRGSCDPQYEVLFVAESS